MAETNSRGAFWGFEVRRRQLAGVWPVTAYVPPLGPLYGWFGGGTGSPKVSAIDRISFASDSSVASVRGSLSIGRYALAATGNASYGWFGGGYGPSPPYPNYLSIVDRVDYAADTATASVRGPLTQMNHLLAATGNDNYGWFGGGYTSPAPGLRSSVNRIDYAADIATASVRGPLSAGRYSLSATGNASYGWFAGGNPAPTKSTVDRINYAADTATAVARGPLSLGNRYQGAAGNANYGWFGGGTSVSYVLRIDYAADTVVTSIRGQLNFSGEAVATGNTNYGWFTQSITVGRMDYAADTNAASLRGSLVQVANGKAATGGFPG